MEVFRKLKSSLPRVQSLLERQPQRQRQMLTQSESGELSPKPSTVAVDSSSSSSKSKSKWKKVDSRSLGIRLSMIPDSSRIVLRILQNQGHDAYLVGGCVRDLLLNRTPKDFDVVTTANLGQIKQKFHRAFIVGRKFPICRVHVKGSTIEVSSFETVARQAAVKEDVHLSEMPEDSDEKDFMRWRNSLHRDFTINSLFYDPFAHAIYDYSNGMADLTAMKLRTVVPAHLSFEEDCARILRGLRIAARLGFSFAKDTEKAIRSRHASVTALDKARIMMEMNYMLSYGFAEPSFILLKRYKLLELLLPFHAAYLAERASAQTPVMLLKLFFNLDRVVSCDQPCNSGLWVSLLAFHLALVNTPQDALVVWTFSSLLYHGNWKEGVGAARKLSMEQVHFTPEILKSLDDMTDEELAQRVSKFASTVIVTLDALTESETLCEFMRRYTSSPSSGLVFISKNSGRSAADIFDVLMCDVEELSEGRQYYSIDYKLLGKGDIQETRFALGKIIMDTMKGGTIHCRNKPPTEEDESRALTMKLENVGVENLTSMVPKLGEQPECKRAKRGLGMSDDKPFQQRTKKQKHDQQVIDLEPKLAREKLGKVLDCQDVAKKRQQLRKVVVTDVKKLLSLQKKMGNRFEMHTPKENLGVLAKVPNFVKQHQNQASKKILGVLKKVPDISKMYPGQAPQAISSIQERDLQMTKQREQVRTELVNVGSLSDIFKGHKYAGEKADGLEKQPAVRDQRRDGSQRKMMGTRKLSSIFK